MKPFCKSLLVFFTALLLVGCSSAPAQPDYRYEEQKQGADKAQKELSREIKRGY